MEALLASILVFFAFGGLGFWLLVLTLSIVYTCAVELDKHGLAIFCTIVAVLLGWNNVAPLFHHWQLLLVSIAAYGVAGGAWSVFRWFKYCKKYIADNPYKHASGSDVRDWENGKEIQLSAEKYYAKKLKPADHKSKLIGWIVYWPWSLIWNVAGDFFTGIYDALVNVYNKVAAAVIKKAVGQ